MVAYGVGFGGMALCIFLVTIQYSYWTSCQMPKICWDTGTSALFNSVSRLLWAIGVWLLMLPLLVNRMKFFVKFFSGSFFVPFSRLSYCVYLVHVLVMIWFNGVGKAPIRLSHTDLFV